MSPDRCKRVLALIVTYGKRADILCRSAVAAFEAGIDELLVVDNAASFDVSETLRGALSEICHERTTVLALQHNLGSAGGFEAGLRWVEAHSDCEFIVLLDDDNLLLLHAAERYLQWFEEMSGSHDSLDRVALLAVRGSNRLLARHGPQIAFTPARSSFLGFSVGNLPRQVFRKMRLRRIRRQEWCGRAIDVESGYYGGLFFHRSLLQRVGYPDPRLFLYGDDLEYTLRMRERGVRLLLVPDIEIDEVESTWAETTRGWSRWARIFNSNSDLRVFCIVRNSVYLTLFRKSANRPLYYLNRFLSQGVFWWHALLSGNWRRYRLIQSAIRDGERGNLGIPEELLKAPADTETTVLLVVETWQIGGTESYVDALCRWLKTSSKYRITVCVLGEIEEEAIASLADTVDSVVVLHGKTQFEKFGRLVALLRQTKPRICHLHLYSSLLPSALAVRLVSRARLVVTLHMPAWQWHRRHRVAWRLALGLSHFVMGNSSATLRSVGRWPAGDQTALVPPPLPMPLLGSSLASIDERPKRISHAFRIGGAGRLAPEKCWSDLIRAFARLANEADARCELCLYGDGSEREALQRLAEELGVAAQVRLNGFLPQRKLHNAISDCDVFVLPSCFEGLGMVAIEAMALGVPTITANFEASSDYIEYGITGHSYLRGDIDELTRLLRWHQAQPKAALQVAQHGATLTREKFHPDRVFMPVLDIYDFGTKSKNGEAGPVSR